jgi:4-hydroxy-4-methyl-2-oxoglutarate aldolase
MGEHTEVDKAVLAELLRFPSPSVINAVELFQVRPRNQGYMDWSVRCLTPGLGRVVGHAATVRIDSRSPHRVDNTAVHAQTLRHVSEMPGPRIVVIEDIADPPGFGCFWGEVQASIYQALGAKAVVTNGAVRDLPETEKIGFMAFAGGLIPSHGFINAIEVGVPVTVGGLVVNPGDLLFGDLHGVVNVPLEIAAEVPEKAREIEAMENGWIDLLKTPGFGPETLIERNYGKMPV